MLTYNDKFRNKSLSIFKRYRSKSIPKSKNIVISNTLNNPKRPILPTNNELTNHIKQNFIDQVQLLDPSIQLKPLSQIKQESETKFYTSYLKPSYQWLSENKLSSDLMSLFNSMNTMSGIHSFTINQLFGKKKDIQWVQETSHFQIDWNDFMSTNLSVGDIVCLRQYPDQLAMCVQLPNQIEDTRYTFALVDGTLVFGFKSAVTLRLPSMFNEEEWGFNLHKSRLVKTNKLTLKSETKTETQKSNNKKRDNNLGYFKNDRNISHFLPVIAKQLISSYLPSYFNEKAWELLPTVERKLFQLHLELRSIKKDTPWQVDLPYILNYLTDNNPNSGKYNTKFDPSLIVATFWSLRNQQEDKILWGDFQFSNASLNPVSITILPNDKLRRAISSLNSHVIQDFVDDYNNNITDKNERTNLEQKYPNIAIFLKDYVAGNLISESIAGPLLCKIFKNLSSYRREHNLSKDLAHKLLTEISKSSSPNPLLKNHELNLESLEIKTDEKIFEFYGDFAELEYKNEPSLPIFKDPIYCIDSIDAHEIDDGISIKHKGGNIYTLSIHIADPTSYFVDIDGNSNTPKLSNYTDIYTIAQNRSFTTYLPDKVQPMFPELFVKQIDLGNKRARTLGFKVDIEFINNNKDINVLRNTFDFQRYNAENIPKGFTYEMVDKILEGDKKVDPEHHKNLTKLYQISNLLYKKRIIEDNAIIFGEGFNKGLVKLDSESQIHFYDNKNTKSTTLVSEIMILANKLSGEYLAKNKIPAIFKSYKELNVDPQVAAKYNNLKLQTKKSLEVTNRSTYLPSFQDITKYMSILNTSTFVCDPNLPHNMLGCKHYATVTSPLRRFPDIINHLQMCAFKQTKKFIFTEQEIRSVLQKNILPRDIILRKYSKKVSKYWTLKQYKVGDILPSIMITSLPVMNSSGFVCLYSQYASGVLRLAPNHSFKVGDIVENCKITKVDALDGVLEASL
ncbi:exoribonuclease II SCDLUD_001253 [Saccharomycodes ludwigii]|uniref:exoribonuclease II n=1 Tax=Saccharomycodes ludwigii TaxID=36035 RepID=UPI001E84EAB5|nr:hypothetical protein SCDLUD_001253 [Saccharomycodes ludwigii]KAH3903609.1 hypothetical protein SCDLUD_001253 [Saccharomycodes ludwigii]